MNKQKKITRRQVQKEDTRKIILHAAYSLFSEKGYTKTTMRALAERAGVGLGTIFKHFPDKPSLLVAAYQEDLAGIISEAFASIPETGLKSQLLHVTGKIYDFYANDPPFSRALIKESLFLEGIHGKMLDMELLTFLNEIAGLFRKAKAGGELATDTNEHEAALVFGSFYFSTLVMGLKQPDFNTKQQLKLVELMIEKYLIGKTCNGEKNGDKS